MIICVFLFVFVLVFRGAELCSWCWLREVGAVGGYIWFLWTWLNWSSQFLCQPIGMSFCKQDSQNTTSPQHERSECVGLSWCVKHGDVVQSTNRCWPVFGYGHPWNFCSVYKLLIMIDVLMFIQLPILLCCHSALLIHVIHPFHLHISQTTNSKHLIVLATIRAANGFNRGP